MPELPRLVLADNDRRKVEVVAALVAIGLSIQGLWAGFDRLWTIARDRRRT